MWTLYDCIYVPTCFIGAEKILFKKWALLNEFSQRENFYMQ